MDRYGSVIPFQSVPLTRPGLGLIPQSGAIGCLPDKIMGHLRRRAVTGVEISC